MYMYLYLSIYRSLSIHLYLYLYLYIYIYIASTTTRASHACLACLCSQRSATGFPRDRCVYDKLVHIISL